MKKTSKKDTLGTIWMFGGEQRRKVYLNWPWGQETYFVCSVLILINCFLLPHGHRMTPCCVVGHQLVKLNF